MGYVALADMLPSKDKIPDGRTADIAITRRARASYGAEEDKDLESDTKLIQYLAKHRHTSPFEGVVFEFVIKCPLFVFNHVVRHRTASLNAQSYRYTKVIDEFYYPDLRAQSRHNKQSSIELSSDKKAACDHLWDDIKKKNAEVYGLYEKLLQEGIAKEVARCCLPQNVMTKFKWQMNLHNLVHFLRLRMGADSQLETQQLAEAIYDIVKSKVPVAMDCLMDSFKN